MKKYFEELMVSWNVVAFNQIKILYLRFIVVSFL